MPASSPGTQFESQFNEKRNPEIQTNDEPLYVHYLLEVNRYDDAKAIYNNQSFFTADERNSAMREIEIVQGYRTHRKT